MTRTFLAADVDDAVLDGAASVAAALPLRCRWVKREVMHCTIRFFGDVDDERLARLVAIVPGLLSARSDAPAVRVTQVDAFPDRRRARVLVLPLEDDGTLAAVHAEIEEHAEALGFERERRPYRAHLTLARFREPTDVRKTLADVAPSFAGRVPSITLYASTLGKDGPTYTVLARRTFALP